MDSGLQQISSLGHVFWTNAKGLIGAGPKSVTLKTRAGSSGHIKAILSKEPTKSFNGPSGPIKAILSKGPTKPPISPMRLSKCKPNFDTSKPTDIPILLATQSAQSKLPVVMESSRDPIEPFPPQILSPNQLSKHSVVVSTSPKELAHQKVDFPSQFEFGSTQIVLLSKSTHVSALTNMVLDSLLESMALVPCTQLAFNGELEDGGFTSPQHLNGSSEDSD